MIIKKTYKKILIVGGGTGLVPLLRLAFYATRLKIQSTVVIGARTKGEVFFENIAKKIIQDTDSSLKICTDDGSYGIRGTTVEVMSKVLHENTFDSVFTCGPELMMRKVVDLSNENSIPVQASLERYMKCGIGICGSCCLDCSLVCQDGTVFNGRQLSKMPDFGIFYRDKDGQRINYS